MARALGEPANQAELMVGTDLEGICSFPHAAVATNNRFFFFKARNNTGPPSFIIRNLRGKKSLLLACSMGRLKGCFVLFCFLKD